MDNKNPEPIRKLLIQKFVQMITAQIAFFSTLWLFFSETFGNAFGKRWPTCFTYTTARLPVIRPHLINKKPYRP